MSGARDDTPVPAADEPPRPVADVSGPDVAAAESAAPGSGQAAAGGRRYRRFGVHRLRLGFRRWRRSRPFWGGLWAILGGLMMLSGPATAIKVLFISNIVWTGITVGLVVASLGALSWMTPGLRHLYGVLIVIGSLISLVTSDIGGFVIGMLLGVLGGSMVFAWVPLTQFPRRDRRHRRLLRRNRGQPGAAEDPAAAA